ncbi:serine/threonine-protein kinase [Nonomuraea angiospora]|uniref:serine/threonine-protein kinase n=1 Tax=Nonomuraea angiospora TaxID=46172 RepID=UPI0029BB2104|nr:protein kinase [Nonomuraea angiospora]MDX3102037.1 protein kinase [Nonomuraea angiospora]
MKYSELKPGLNIVSPVAADVRGERVAGRYRVLTALGQGGMGTIWLAHDELLDRQVAIKELRIPESLPASEREEAVQRSMREAMAAAQLRHPNIITIHDVLVHNGMSWIVMELLTGRDLKDAVAAEGPWAPQRVATLGLQMLDALSTAHAHGIQHRDVKPANVFLTDDGRVVLTDFGIARLEDQATITESGLLLGSPGYIAPERLRGERGGPASDLWSLAATLYSAVEGMAPYAGTSPMAVLRDALTLPPRAPTRAGSLGPVLIHMMAREPHQRPDARTAAHLLQRVAQGQDVTAPPTAPRRWRRHGPILAVAGAAAVAAVVVTVALLPTSVPAPTRPTSNAGAQAATSVPGRTPTAPATPIAGTSEPVARFTVPVNPCALMTPTQVRLLVPKAAAEGRRDGEGCDWTARGNGVGVSPLRPAKVDSAWGRSLDEASEAFVNRLNSAASGSRIPWKWPDIGLEKMITQGRSPSQEVDGIGDEAFSYVYVNPKGQVERHDVVFRLSNVVIEIKYVDLSKVGDDEALRKGARDAARWVAAALGSQE